jgi:hypothetical protein
MKMDSSLALLLLVRKDQVHHYEEKTDFLTAEAFREKGAILQGKNVL